MPSIGSLQRHRSFNFCTKLLTKANNVPAYSAPARATDYYGLPPAITLVGEVETFRDGVLQYIDKLPEAGRRRFSVVSGLLPWLLQHMSQGGIKLSIPQIFARPFSQCRAALLPRPASRTRSPEAATTPMPASRWGIHWLSRLCLGTPSAGENTGSRRYLPALR